MFIRFPLGRLIVGAELIFVSSVGAQQRDTVTTDSTTSRRRLAPITIVATPATRSAPSSALHLDASALRLAPATNTFDLLRQTSGLEVHEQGQGPGFTSNASLRGFSSDHSTDVALWIDGVPVNEPVNGHAEGYNDFAVLYPAAVSDIDVIRGPTSALFGNFALAGVVNVRTLERMRGTELSVTGGSSGRGEFNVLSGFDHGARGGGVLGLRYEHEDGFRPNARFDLGQAHARVVHDLNSTLRVDGGVELYRTRWHSPGFLGEEDFAAGDYDIVSNPSDGGYKRRAQERLSVRVLRGDMLWRTTAYATQGRWQLYLTIPPAGGRFEGTGSQTEEEDGRHGYGLTSAVTWERARATVTLGGEARWDRASYDNWFTTDRARDSVAETVTSTQRSAAAFARATIELTSRWRAELGLRADAISTRATTVDAGGVSASHAVLSPKVGTIVRITPLVSAYANVSRGFRSADGIISEPTLTPITLWAYETGLKLDRGTTSASAAVFRMDVSNEQTFNPLTGASNNGGASVRNGIELDARGRMGRFVTFNTDWTLLGAKYRHLTAIPEDGDGDPVVLDHLRVYNTARYTGLVTLDWSPRPEHWLLRATGNFVGPYTPFERPGEELGAYGLLHLSGEWAVGRVRTSVGVRNVLDRRYPDLIAGEVVAPGRPRSFFVTMRAAL